MDTDIDEIRLQLMIHRNSLQNDTPAPVDLSSAFEEAPPSQKTTPTSNVGTNRRPANVNVDNVGTVYETPDGPSLHHEDDEHSSSVHQSEPPQPTSVDVFTQDHSTPEKAAGTCSLTKTLIYVDKTATMQAMDDKQQHIIDVPDTIESLRPWAANIKEEVDKKSFVLQFNITKNVKSIRGRIFRWMGSIRSFTKVGTIVCADIACIGFFSLFHPDHQNRDILHKYVLKYLRHHVDEDMEVSIYSRQVYAGKGVHKAETRATVVDVAKHHVKGAIEALHDCPFPDHDGVTFVPFVKNDNTYTDSQNE